MGEITVPAFGYKDRKFPRIIMSDSILEARKPAYELVPRSISLGHQTALFEIGFLETLGVDTRMPDGVKRAAISHYNTVMSDNNKGNCNGTVFDYSRKTKRPTAQREASGYQKIAVIDWPNLVKRNGVWHAQAGSDSEVMEVDMPPSGLFSMWTMDGIYDASGVPYQTGQSDEAQKSVREFIRRNSQMSAGETAKLAEKVSSPFYRYENERKAVSPVFRCSQNYDKFSVIGLLSFEREDSLFGTFLSR
jgi:hypothetical protein